MASKNQKAFIIDLKRLYRAANLDAAEIALNDVEALRGRAKSYRYQTLAQQLGKSVGVF